MSLNKDLIDKIINVTSKAAISCYRFIGKNQKKNADKAATDSMRNEINKLSINGKVVIGEGELDEAPMLYIGEKLGLGGNLNLDIAVDPLEGTNFVAKNLPGAISVIAISKKNNLFNAPESYMEKISYPSGIDQNAIDLDFSLKKNLSNLADSKNKKFESLKICVLDRPRHKKIIDELNTLGVQLKLISDGDVSGALLVTNNKYNVDLFLGIGGGPEGVLAACALDAFNCFFQGKFIFESDTDKLRANEMGIKEFDKKYKVGFELKDEITNIDLNKEVIALWFFKERSDSNSQPRINLKNKLITYFPNAFFLTKSKDIKIVEQKRKYIRRPMIQLDISAKTFDGIMERFK